MMSMRMILRVGGRIAIVRAPDSEKRTGDQN
jgi:hypothetical protein